MSIFTGIGGFDRGFERAGMDCAGQAEKDPYCNMILRRHWPDAWRITNVGKISTNSNFQRPEIICGGFPCQDLSVAGRRQGLDGSRSGLWFELLRIVGLINPPWVVIENVPGLLSSNHGADFEVILRGLEEFGYYAAWRTFDSQYFNVAQRRERLFIVASAGNARCTEVLFEPESLRRDPAQGRKTQTGIARCLTSSTGGCSAKESQQTMIDPENNPLNPLCGPLKTKPWSDNGTQEKNLIAIKTPLNDLDGVCRSITGSGKTFGSGRGSQDTFILDIAGTLQTPTGGYTTADTILANEGSTITHEGFNFKPHNLIYLESRYARNGRGSADTASGDFGVRRLTPRECERLQGFPDDFTGHGINAAGKRVDISDTQRYKMLGNAVTVQVAQWIAKRIVSVDKTSQP